MATLSTVEAYISQARVLLQDTVDLPYRYADAELIDALNRGLLEIRRIRPDLMLQYVTSSVPTIATGAVPLDEQYRTALLYYIVGQAQLRDDENTQDARATVFLNKFVAQLLTIQS